MSTALAKKRAERRAPICDQALQSAVLLPQLPQLAQLLHPQAHILLFPGAERGLAHPQLAVISATLSPLSYCFSAAMICSSLCPFLGMLNLLVGHSRPTTAYDTSSFLCYGLWGLGHSVDTGGRAARTWSAELEIGLGTVV